MSADRGTLAATIRGLVEGRDLDRGEARDLVLEVVTGAATPAQIGAMLAAWRMKGETVDEVAGAADAMRSQATAITSRRHPVTDTCGTGGDGAGTFNLSTAAAIVASAAGACVAKHGNRSVSSACGSADILEALGVAIDLPPESVARCLDEVGLGFLYAPRFHPAMRHVAAPRRELGMRTIFNLLGPLTNPAGARRQIVGVYSLEVGELLASALVQLGSEHALVVHGAGGLDELVLDGPNHVFEVRAGSVRRSTLTPEDAGLERRPAALKGGPAAHNAELMAALLGGWEGDLADCVALNAGAALYVAGVADSIRAGVAEAGGVLRRGEAARHFDRFRDLTRHLAPKSTEPAP